MPVTWWYFYRQKLDINTTRYYWSHIVAPVSVHTLRILDNEVLYEIVESRQCSVIQGSRGGFNVWCEPGL
jgi:hypothetical protein